MKTYQPSFDQAPPVERLLTAIEPAGSSPCQ